MIKNIFLDRDGIINDVIMRTGKASSPRSVDEFNIRNDFIIFYNKIIPFKPTLFVVSNQPDIARKRLPLENLNAIDAKILERFKFSEICYCVHDNVNNCLCRKPKPGLITNLLEKYHLKADESVLIGDMQKDIIAGQLAGIKTILLCTHYNKDYLCNPTYSVNQLVQAIPLIYPEEI